MWGVLYELNEADLKMLDTFEGFRGIGEQNGYSRISVEVEPLRGEPFEALTYEVPHDAKRDEAECVTNTSYLRHLLEGAAYWKLPADYREMVAGFEP